MIRVLHLRDTSKLCGPGKTILETASRIDKRNYELYIGVFLLEKEQTNAYCDEIRRRGEKVVEIRSRHQFDPAIVSTIIKIVREHNIDIIHAHEYKSDIITYFVRKFIDIPIVTTVHGWIAFDLKRKIYIKLGKMVLPSFDKVIAVSPKIRNELLSGRMKSDKVPLVFNAIVTEDYQPSDYDRGFLRNMFGLSNDDILIGNIGRLSPEKGQQDFIFAATKVLENRSNVYFILVGDGQNRERLESMVKEKGLEGRVLFTGHIKEIKKVFRDIDCMALTSYTEGFPNVVLEALCMDTPVLATNVGGVPEIVENNETGILVEPKDVAAISRGLEKYLDNPEFAKKTVEKGKAKVFERYTFEQRVERIENLYDELIENHHAR